MGPGAVCAIATQQGPMPTSPRRTVGSSRDQRSDVAQFDAPPSLRLWLRRSAAVCAINDPSRTLDRSQHLREVDAPLSPLLGHKRSHQGVVGVDDRQVLVDLVDHGEAAVADDLGH